MYFTVDGEGLTEVEYDWKNDKSWFGGERCFYSLHQFTSISHTTVAMKCWVFSSGFGRQH